MRSGHAVFGTVDTWLSHKLKNLNGFEKNEPIPDVSNASATGLFDPFDTYHNSLNLRYFKIKKRILSIVVDNSFDFGYAHKSLLGALATTIADQVIR